MSKIGIFYGSTTGNTESAAKKIKDILGVDADIANVSSSSIEDMTKYDNLILGSSTWGLGDIQDDWGTVINKLSEADFSGKKVALFGTGDQNAYTDTFVDAIGLLYEALENSGAEFIGAWPSEGYEYSDSKAERNGMFVGLALDEDNQAEMTDERIAKWVQNLKQNL